MFVWSNGWRSFTDEKHQRYLEQELTWELAENPQHVIAGRHLKAVAWLGWYDDLIVQLDGQQEFAWVHLSWNRENQPHWPHCEVLGGVEAVNRFVAEWSQQHEEDANPPRASPAPQD